MLRQALGVGRALQPSRVLQASHRAIPSRAHARAFHASARASELRRRGGEEEMHSEDAFDLLEDEFEDDDTTTLGHHMIDELRDKLYYMRLIEHECPKLVAFRKPFVPPSPERPLIVRSIDYAGEGHPVTNKRAITVSVDELPLHSERAKHKVKLLAGTRWTPSPPKDAGVQGSAVWANGFIKISCEDFPDPAMNLKWIRDTLVRLCKEANNPDDQFQLSELPVDMRHVFAQRKKAKKGDHIRDRVFHKPTIYDFPAEWLKPEHRRPVQQIPEQFSAAADGIMSAARNADWDDNVLAQKMHPQWAGEVDGFEVPRTSRGKVDKAKLEEKLRNIDPALLDAYRASVSAPQKPAPKTEARP
ncbi:mitochondrial ribosomal subunit protein-domain-containing protein [Schizophyllum commune]